MSLDRRFFEDVPKAQVHVHLDGALPPEDIWLISQKLGIELPGIPEQTRDALERFYCVDPSCRFDTPEKFDAFLKKFGPVIHLMQTPAGLRETAQAHVEDLSRQGHIYAETRFAPQYHCQKGLSLEDVIRNVLDGLDAGRRETGALVKLIVSIGRECGWETAVAVAKAAMEFQYSGVVALDLACNEELYPPELHTEAYRETFNSRLKRTVHAGEFPTDPRTRTKNIHTALYDLRADGLGHAISLAQEEDLRSRVAKSRIRIESCPFSNIMTGAVRDLRELALDVLLREGVLVSLNTDDPLMFGTSMADVLEQTCRVYNFRPDDIRAFMRNAVAGAFCTDSERQYVYNQFSRRGFPLQPIPPS